MTGIKQISQLEKIVANIKKAWLQYTAIAAIFGSIFYSGISHEKVRSAKESDKKEYKEIKDSARYYYKEINTDLTGIKTLVQDIYDTVIFTSGMQIVTSQALKTHLSNEKALKELIDFQNAEIERLKKNNYPGIPQF